MITKEFIEKLYTPFSAYIDGKADENALVSAIQFWFFSLPKYTKVTANRYVGDGKFSCIDSRILRFRDCLRAPEIDADKLFLEKLPDIFDETDLAPLADCVVQAKSEIDSILPAMLETLQNDICIIFRCRNKSVLRQVLSGWYEQLPERTKRHCFEHGEERLLEAVIKGGNSISVLCSILIGMELENFEENTPALLFSKISEYKNVIESHPADRQSGLKDTYSIFLDRQAVKTFRKTPDVSSIGRLMQNELAAVVSEYGQAVGLNEKRQILLNVLDGIGNGYDGGMCNGLS